MRGERAWSMAVVVAAVAMVLMSVPGSMANGGDPATERAASAYELVVDEERGVKTLVLELPAEAASDGGEVPGEKSSAFCGGFAPLLLDCAGGGIFGCCSIELRMDAGIEFQGWVQNAGRTSTGAWDWQCTFYTRLLPVCDLQQSGVFFVGQSYVLEGHSDLLSTGTWEVGVVN